MLGELSMSSGQKPDFRNAIRFPLHLPVALQTAIGECMPGETLGAAEDVLVQCDGRVVRSCQEGSGRIVAVAIDEYRFERQ